MDYSIDDDLIIHDAVENHVRSHRKAARSRNYFWPLTSGQWMLGKHVEDLLDAVKYAIGGRWIFGSNVGPDIQHVLARPARQPDV